MGNALRVSDEWGWVPGQLEAFVQEQVDQQVHFGPRPLGVGIESLGDPISPFQRNQQMFLRSCEEPSHSLVVVREEASHLGEGIMPMNGRLLVLEVQQGPQFEAGVRGYGQNPDGQLVVILRILRIQRCSEVKRFVVGAMLVAIENGKHHIGRPAPERVLPILEDLPGGFHDLSWFGDPGVCHEEVRGMDPHRDLDFAQVVRFSLLSLADHQEAAPRLAASELALQLGALTIPGVMVPWHQGSAATKKGTAPNRPSR